MPRYGFLYFGLAYFDRLLWHVEVKMAVITIHTLANLVPAAFANWLFLWEPETVAHGRPHDAIDGFMGARRPTAIIFFTAGATPS